ncbi:MAG: hypothetical protein ACLT0Y_05465 [Christensenellales bacterium]
MAEQQDLKDIQTYYQKDGGEFWIAKSDGKVIGTLGLQFRENHCAVMKKFLWTAIIVCKKTGFPSIKIACFCQRQRRAPYHPGYAVCGPRFT